VRLNLFDVGNGDSAGFYWPIGGESREPIVCDMHHDGTYLEPEACSLEGLVRLRIASGWVKPGDHHWSDILAISESLQIELPEAPPQGLPLHEVPLDACPDSPSLKHAHAEEAFRRGDLNQAEAICRDALRLTSRDVVKHHKKNDEFALAHDHREQVNRQLEELLSEHSLPIREGADEVRRQGAQLGFDFDYIPDDMAVDALALIDRTLHERGRLAAVALVTNGEFVGTRPSLERTATNLIDTHPDTFKTLKPLGRDRFLDVVPGLAEHFAQYPTARMVRRFRGASDAYCLRFILQQTPDVQDALQKIIAGTTMLVDASVLVPCMAETLLPPGATEAFELAPRRNGTWLSPGDWRGRLE
jgi:hypothetical protein